MVTVTHHDSVLDRTSPLSDPLRHGEGHRTRSTGTVATLDAAFVVLVVGTTALVVGDGSFRWRLVRGAAVIVVVSLALAAHRRRAMGGLATVTCGVVAVALGLTFGVRYAAFGAWQWRTIIGLVEVADGVALSVVGARRAISHQQLRWRRVALTAAIALAALTATYVIAPALMATNVPPVASGDVDRIENALGARQVTFESADGVELAGWFVPSHNGATVVLRHGAGRSTAASAAGHAEVLAAHGYGVLLTDARGHGASGGRAMDYGWYGERDIAAAVTFLLRQPGVDPGRIGVVGLSMGGEEAIGAIGLDARIAAVVAEGATARTAGDKAWLPDAYGWRGRAQRWFDAAQFGLTDLLTDAPRPATLASSAAAARPRPILMIAAGDVPDEARAAVHIATHAPLSVEVWTVAGASHTGALDLDRGAWEQHVVTFLDAHLLDDAGGADEPDG